MRAVRLGPAALPRVRVGEPNSGADVAMVGLAQGADMARERDLLTRRVTAGFVLDGFQSLRSRRRKRADERCIRGLATDGRRAIVPGK